MKEKVKKWNQKHGHKFDEGDYDAYAEIKSHIDAVTTHLEDTEDVLEVDEDGTRHGSRRGFRYRLVQSRVLKKFYVHVHYFSS